MRSITSAITRRFSIRMSMACRKGQALVTAMALVVALTILVAATQHQVVQELKVTKTERDYERALQLAEAGLNAYINRIDYGAAPADVSNPNDPGHLIPPLREFPIGAAPSLADFRRGVRDGTYTLIRYPPGSQQGYLVGSIGTPGETARFISFGWSNGVVRRVVGVARQASGDYALYGVASVTMHNNQSVTGNVGTNGQVTMHNNNEIENGYLVLNGPGADVSQHKNPGIRVRRGPTPYRWPTVAEIALEKWPNSGATAPGGLEYLATHNDNDLATIDGVPGIPGNKIDLKNNSTVVFRGKPGGAHYYLTGLTGKNNGTIHLDNSAGPITIWFGPSGGNGEFEMKNGWDLTQAVTDPAHLCRFYVATRGGVTIKNNGASAIGIYAYNVENGQPFGSVTLKNNSTFTNCRIIANTISVEQNTTITYTPAPYFYPEDNLYAITDWREFE
ncbi:MAG TPA: hypothetical protein PLY56_05580 [Armatimonadota bacterium]|nr:hypothetical protein [Armatimonadota bacterium]HOM80805.1 hypothetical protein [Armatimonadota bacterium]HPO74469.1 hypothetical protein [Armatimonadota bacterium]